MGIFRQFPYSNFHDMNMDQIIKIMREMQDEWTETKTEWANYKDFIDNYFANLDVSNEVLQALRTLAASGELNKVIDPVIANATTEWLTEHVTPTTPIVDNTLTIKGAAADAKATGDRIKQQVGGLENSLYHREFNVLDFIPKESRTAHGVTFTWNEDGSCTVTGISDTSIVTCNIIANAFPPFIHEGVPVSLKIESDSDDPKVNLELYRYVDNTLSTAWINNMTAAYQGEGVRNDTVPTGITGLLIRLAVKGSGTYVNETVRVSMVPQESMENIPFAYRFTDDANNLKRNGIYFVSSDTSIENLPFDGACWLDVNCVGYKSSVGVLQIAYPWTPDLFDVHYRVCRLGNWTAWHPLGSGEGGSTVIQNVYNITTNPHITTDANGWLRPVDTDTVSEIGKTDMTGPIMSMLTETGYCHLAKGIYYVSGSIDMPPGSTLIGCGQDTIIRLLSDVESGYIVKVGEFNTVKGIRFSGARSSYEPAQTIGNRNAINFTSNADTTTTTVQQCVIDNCWIENFNGSGIYCYNTGGAPDKALTVTNTYIKRCSAGVNIAYYSEYQKYTNVIIERCYYACINNGGNNVFTACTFHGTIGFVLGNLRNNAHGSCVGCTFNHIDSWNYPDQHGGGIAVKADNTSSGFIFTGCQFWYSTINITNSIGIIISNSLFGGNTPTIAVSGSYPAFFNGCIFHAAPTLNVNESTKFNNCYLDETGAIIEP